MWQSSFAIAPGQVVPVTDGKAPDWALIVPAGKFTDVHGQEWDNSKPDLIVETFRANKIDLVLDWEHATLHAEPGSRVDAAAWIPELENRAGAIWGKFAWTGAGREAVEAQAQRYLSPVLVHSEDRSKIFAIQSVGLTVLPRIDMPALSEVTLNSLRSQFRTVIPSQEAVMPDAVVSPQLRAIFDIPESMSDADALKKIKEAQVQARTTASRAQTAEEQLAAEKAQRRDAEIEAVLDKYVKKFVPAERPMLKKICEGEDGIKTFETAMSARPDLPQTRETEMPGANDLPDRGGDGTESEKACASAIGLTVTEFRARKKEFEAAGEGVTHRGGVGQRMTADAVKVTGMTAAKTQEQTAV